MNRLYKTALGLLLFLTLLLDFTPAHAQIYLHRFSTATTATGTYSAPPDIIDPRLTSPGWINGRNVAWASGNGSGGNGDNALQLSTNAQPNQYYQMTFNVASGFSASITSFNFWTRSTNAGPSNWQLIINGTTVGSGATAGTGGASIGVTNVSTPITGLTGLVTVRLNLTGATGGNIRLDDFTLNGSVISLCNAATVSSFTPATGPVGTTVTYTGTGFNGVTGVTFDGIPATAYNIVSNTTLTAVVPSGTTAGAVTFQTATCPVQPNSNFSILEKECGNIDVYISEIFDDQRGSGGVVELYNPTRSDINFNGPDTYVLECYQTIGDASPRGGTQYTITLRGTIPSHGTMLIESGNGDLTCTSLPLSSNAIGGINEDDQIKLKKNGIYKDDARAPAYTGYTARRNPTALAPTMNYNASDWYISGRGGEVCTDLGRHTENVTIVPPTITQPVSVAVCEGANATFSVSVSGSSTGVTYQWRTVNTAGNWVNVTNNATYSGATTATLTINNVTAALDKTQYYCYITTPTCLLYSNAALLTIGGALPIPVVTVTPATCATGGTALVTNPTGTGITYSLNSATFTSNPSFTNLTAGSYNIVAKNAAGCTSAPFNFNIAAPAGAPAAPTLSAVQPTCTTTTGTITVTNAAAGLEYQLDSGAFQTTATFNSVAPGSHTVTVRDSAGCSNSANITINTVPAAPAAPTLSATQPTCVVPGSITVTNAATGLEYQLDSGAFQTTATFNSVGTGSHTITVRNAGGCTNSATITINAVPNAPAAPILSATRPNCTTPTGSITVTNSAAGLQYQLDSGAFQTIATFNGVASGSHTVTVRNAAGCTNSSTTVIDAQPATPAAPVLSPTQPTCATATGSITVTNTATGLQYQLDSGAFQTTATFNSVAPGSHTVTVKNAAGCTNSATVTINAQPTTPAVPALSATQPNCTTAGSISVTNAAAGLEYQLDSGAFQATATFNSVGSGNHTVTVRNAAGCTNSATVTINTQPTAPAVPTLTAVQPTCTTATGSITVTNTVAGLEYQLDSGAFQTTATFNSVTTGSHTVTVRNAAGCTNSATITINAQPAQPAVPALSAVQPTCTTATASITVTNATTGLEYQLDSGTFQTVATFNNVASGNHTVTVRNAAGCTNSATVTINAAPTAPAVPTLTAVQPTCTTATGSITVTNTVAGLEYQLDSGAFQTTATFNSVAAGNHTVTVRNAAGCTNSATITINAQPAQPAVPALSPTQPTCATATGTISVTNAAAGLEYQLDSGAFQATATFNNVAAGSHTVTVRNATGCTNSATVTINAQPTTPVAPALSATQPTCTVAGSITITNAAGGLEYQLDSGTFQNTGTFTGVASGNHTITVRNAGGCTNSATITINAAPATPAVPALSAIQPTCATQSGTITVTNAVPGLEYQLDSGTFQNTGTFTAVAAGNHTITVRNAAGCTNSATITINTAPGTPSAPLLTAIQPTCTTPTGSITVGNTATGLQYQLDSGAFQATGTFNSVAPGSHTVTVRNAAGCTNSATITINPALTAPAAPVLSATQPTCAAPLGTITVTNAVTGLEYRLDSGAFQNTATFSNLAPGNHSVTVRNADGCTNSATITINAAPTIPRPAFTYIQPTCQVTTGTITVTTPTGTRYQYSLDSGMLQNSPVFAGVTPGSHIITVQSSAGCTSSATATLLPVPSAPAAPVTTEVQPTCTVATGQITVTAPVGTGFQYSINGGAFQNARVFGSLTAGSYTITVRNARGCETVGTPILINAAPATPATPVLTATQPQCGDTTGSITITPVAGTGITYSLNGGAYQAAVNFNFLNPGTYTVIAKNASGCISAPATIRINTPPATPAIPRITAVQPTCAMPFGTITVGSPTGAGYTYSIDGTNFQTGLVFTNLTAGGYNVTVKNAAGCTAISAMVFIDAAPAPAPAPGTITGGNAVCMDDTLQLANIATGGVWSISNDRIATIDQNGLVTPVRVGTAIVYYTVGTVCTAQTQQTITVNGLPNIKMKNLYLCVDNKTQAVLAPKTLNSGLPNSGYTFVWEKGGNILPDTTASIQVSEPGIYTVTATITATGCTASGTATVGLSSIAMAVAEVAEDFHRNQAVTITVTGGSGDYVFSMDNGAFQTSPVFTGVTQGEHTVSVYDNNGCGKIELEVFVLDYPRFFTANNDGTNDTWKIDGLSGQRDAVVYIYDRYGKLITALRPASNQGWDGTLNGHPLPATDYWFSVLYTSSNGSKKEFRAHFSLLR